MKEEKKHLYRIDPMKIQQKIYSLYPANSAVRKQMIREEKMREYTKLSKVLSSIPKQVTEELVVNSQRTVYYGVLKGILFASFALVMFLLLPFTVTILESILLSALGVVAMFAAFIKFLKVVKLLYSIRLYEKSIGSVKTRLESLKKDIFE